MSSSKPDIAEPTTFGPHPDDADEVREAIDEEAKQKSPAPPLTPEQLKHWAETGEWPESSA